MNSARSLLAGLAIAAIVLLQACAPLSLLEDRLPSMALQDTADTRLGRTIVPLAHAHPDKSGVVALPDGRDAFAARVLLANAAERSLDLQYYIWHKDLSGTLLADAVKRAADRGVRVRLLLDDNNTAGLDLSIAALDAHPNIEIRLFNPFATRSWRALGFVFDFGRANRRMHNKSFTVDNQITVIGGRNIGDEYFGAGRDLLFVDLDVLAIGPVVHDVSNDFDRYWASSSAYPVRPLLGPIATASIAELSAAARRVVDDTTARDYTRALAESPFVRDLLAHRLPIEWADVHMVSDDPSKALGEATDDELLWTRLKRVLKAPTRELALVSPYFVPGAAGVAELAAMTRRGVKVSVLTNSLAATDVPAVHAGYAKRRRALLHAGVVLYEMKASPQAAVAASAVRELGGSSGSGSSLHAKTFSVDGESVFIGSFNFDPRSARLNTELGFVIDSPALAQSIGAAFDRLLTRQAYEVRLTEEGRMQWIERIDGQEVVHDDEPGTSFWKRLGVSVLSRLPIDWLL